MDNPVLAQVGVLFKTLPGIVVQINWMGASL